MEPLAISHEESDLAFPQREAAFFDGLFLRGHSADELRRDIKFRPPSSRNGIATPSTSRACANFSIA